MMFGLANLGDSGMCHSHSMMTPRQGIDKQELFQILESVTSRTVRVNIDSVSVAYIRATLKCIGEPNSIVEELWLSRGTLNAELCSSLACLIESNKRLKVLHFREINIDDIGASYIFHKIAGIAHRCSYHHSITTDTNSIEELHLDLNGFGGISNSKNNAFISLLKSHNTSLKILHLTDCNLGYEGGVAIAKALEYNFTLQDLVLQGTYLMPGVGNAFKKLLLKNQTLKSLFFLGNPQLTSQDISEIFRGLQSNSNRSLKALAIQENKIDYDTAVVIAKTLRTNAFLQKLCLWSNDMGPKEAIVIANSLQRNKTLRELRFRMNPIGDEGVQGIFETLHVNKSIQLLDLEFTGMSDIAAQFIVETLKEKNFVLTKLVLYGNNDVEKETKNEIDYYLQLNRSLRRIWHSNTFPASLWPLALQRINNKSDLLFQALRHKPELVDCNKN